MAVSVFISYSHKDKHLREKLESHLSMTHRQRLIDAWYDGQIAPGQEWKHEISSDLPSSLEAAELSQKHGYRRCLENIYGMKRYLSRKALTYLKAEAELSEILEGSLVQWIKLEEPYPASHTILAI